MNLYNMLIDNSLEDKRPKFHEPAMRFRPAQYTPMPLESHTCAGQGEIEIAP
jgi:hypothetical protein